MLHTTFSPAEHATYPPVLLVHGFASSAGEHFLSTGWVDTLNASGRTVITVDLPGHGASPTVSSPAEASTSAVIRAILKAVTPHVPEGPFDVVGYSLGGRLAWELPALDERVRRVVLGGVSPVEPFGAVAPDALSTALAGGEPATLIVGIMAMMISAPGRDTASLAHVISGLASQPFAPTDGGPTVPTLLIAGESDQMTQGIESLVDALPNARLVSVPGDHRGALDSAEIRAEAIAFLSE